MVLKTEIKTINCYIYLITHDERLTKTGLKELGLELLRRANV